jgi:pyruvate formate lyase activating enzyme
MTVSELLDDVLKYKSYIQSGGFTASGGEPLQQAQFIAELFKQLKHHNIHTAIDTSGHTSGYAQLSGSIQELLSYTDLVLLDIKSINPDKYRELTAVDIHTTLQFAEYLSVKNIPVWIRYVIVPGLTDNESEMEALAKYLCSFSNIERVELLPFHKMGEHKWEAMKLPYYLKETPVPGNEIMQSAKEIFDKYSLPA